MKAEIITKVSKKNNNEYQCLKITIGEWSGLMFLQKYELMFVREQIKKLEQKQLTTDKDSVDASLFD